MKYFLAGIVTMFGGMGFIIFYETTYLTEICTESHKVVDILELKYRDADILLENGSVVTVSQQRLKIGDDWCVSKETVRKDSL